MNLFLSVKLALHKRIFLGLSGFLYTLIPPPCPIFSELSTTWYIYPSSSFVIIVIEQYLVILMPHNHNHYYICTPAGTQHSFIKRCAVCKAPLSRFNPEKALYNNAGVLFFRESLSVGKHITRNEWNLSGQSTLTTLFNKRFRADSVDDLLNEEFHMEPKHKKV